MNERKVKTIAILGGGPSGLFMFKRLVDAGQKDVSITIYERKSQLGAGMPYSTEGANLEHITNVSDNEIPEMVCSVEEWVQTLPQSELQKFGIDPNHFNEYKVLPRLLFGNYLSAQFELFLKKAKQNGLSVDVLTNVDVTDVKDHPNEKSVIVYAGDRATSFDAVIICTGHNWPRKHEDKVPRYFDSPYPPSKLAVKTPYPVALRGSSLTAIDAIRTLARQNGSFNRNANGLLQFQLNQDSEGFEIVMHSRNGFLPAIRFHLEDSHLSKDSVLGNEEVSSVMASNDGFLPLDYLFERNFKDGLREQDPEFYQEVKDMTIETFVEKMMSLRERLDAFTLFKAEYAEAEKSIKRQQSVSWKEMLAVLSFAMNYPAKHLSAEDMLRLQKTLMPLISIVIAFVPQSSADEMLALYDAGLLRLVAVGDDNNVIPQKEGGAVVEYKDEEENQHSTYYEMFVDSIGQPHLSYHDFPFPSMVSQQTISPAHLKFRSSDEGAKAMQEGNPKVQSSESGDYYLQVPGITINDDFQVVDKYGAYNDRIYIMAVPYIGGYNPDYSGLDFSEAASARIVKKMLPHPIVSE